MDTLKLKAVLRAIETGSMANAAREFSYTPSALSHSINSLERELGAKLLERNYKGVSFTESGKKLEPKLRAVLEAEKELYKSAKQLTDTANKTLHIGAYASISTTFLPEILNGFKEKYPEISISVTLGNYLSGWLREGISDVVLGTKIKDAQWLPVMKDEFMAVVPEGIFLGRNTISMQELYPFTLIMSDTKIGDIQLNLSQFKEVLPFEAEGYDSVISLVKEGMGISFIPKLALKKQQKGIKVLGLNPPIYRTLGVSYNKGIEKTSSAMLFIEYLKQLFKN